MNRNPHAPIYGPPSTKSGASEAAKATGIGLIALISGLILGSCGGSSDGAAAPAPTVTKTVTATAPASETTRTVLETPKACVRALVAADEIHKLSAEAFILAGKAVKAAGTGDLAALTEVNEQLAPIQEAMPKAQRAYQTQAEGCRVAAKADV